MCNKHVLQAHTCLHSIESDVLAFGLVTLGNDGWDSAKVRMISFATTTISRRRDAILLAASFAMFRHGRIFEPGVEGAFSSVDW
jgi:hypothetical protein